jgi:hypothetical protein
MRRPITFVLLFVFVLLLSACQSQVLEESTPTSVANKELTDSPMTSTSPALPTEAEEPVETNTNTPLPTATNTLIATIAPTMLPTQFMGFDQARVFKAFAYTDETVFYFIVPGVAASYFGTVDGYDLTCEPDIDQVNLLVCRSDEDLFGTDWKDFEFYSDEERSFLVYEGEFSTTLDKLPPTPTPAGIFWPRADFTADDITWGSKPPGCSVRGVNLTCETEYREYSDGSCVVGMSCYDSCGYYYSVNTIDGKTGPWVGRGPCW